MTAEQRPTATRHCPAKTRSPRCTELLCIDNRCETRSEMHALLHLDIIHMLLKPSGTSDEINNDSHTNLNSSHLMTFEGAVGLGFRRETCSNQRNATKMRTIVLQLSSCGSWSTSHRKKNNILCTQVRDPWRPMSTIAPMRCLNLNVWRWAHNFSLCCFPTLFFHHAVFSTVPNSLQN